MQAIRDMHSGWIFDEFWLQKWSTEIRKIVKLYWFYNHFLLSSYFNIRWLWDTFRVPTWVDLGFKNDSKSALGRLLGRLVGILAASWAVLEAS